MDCSKWVSHDTVPVNLQLYEKMRNSILGGEIQPGGKLPSIRGMATLLHISANTVTKAFWLLSNQKLILCSNGKGYNVTPDALYVQQQKQKQVRILCCTYIQKMLKLSYTKEEAILLIRKSFPNLH